MKIIKYKDLEWYVIKEDDFQKLLLLKDSFTNEQIKKYFTSKEMVDNDYDVRFNKDYSNPWWRDSYIRMVLNTKFLEDLDIEDLLIMDSTVSLNTTAVKTQDYIRLLTKEEVEDLKRTNLEVLKTERKYGYWTMSPYGFGSGNAYVFFVYGASSSPGYLFNGWVNNSYAVRPVISIKSSVLVSEVTDNIANDHDCEVELEEIDDVEDIEVEELAEKYNDMIRYIKHLESELKDNE